jgi:copper chaperone CopZ
MGKMEYHKSTLRVLGMSCGGCEKAVERALLSVPGVISAVANRERQEVAVEFNPTGTSEPALKQAIEKSGYKVA